MVTENAGPLTAQLSSLEATDLTLVGGKAASLGRLVRAGFSVPAGFALTTRFFEPWLVHICASAEWRLVEALLDVSGSRPNLEQRSVLEQNCAALKKLGRGLGVGTHQQQQLSDALASLGEAPYAVRSSSPEEDLAGTSFAGLYETVLGADADSIEDAVRKCFCSCLDARVLLYKVEMGFSRPDPAIAVVIQRLVDSEVSGVAFSLNPLTNDYDEVLINASWGKGEALVTGDITPDTIVADGLNGAVVSYKTGDKGGDRADAQCLSPEQIETLAETVKRVETLYQQPVDVEWAFTAGDLHVLQARPVTAYVPLHESLLTAPGEPRQLYMDGYLTDGVTMSAATTPMADDVLGFLMLSMIGWMFGAVVTAEDTARYGMHQQVNRMYLNISMYMHLLGKSDALVKQAQAMNPMMAALFLSPELERYRPLKPPRHVGWLRCLLVVPGLLWRTRRAGSVLFGPAFRSEVFDARYKTVLAEFEAWVTRPVDFAEEICASLEAGLRKAGEATIESSYPAYVYYYVQSFRIKALVGNKTPEMAALADDLLGGHEDDMVLQMGLAIYNMSRMLGNETFDDIPALEARLLKRELPEAFLAKWDDFVVRYGCRGPLEMEISNPGYAESPRLALQQMASFRNTGSDYDPNLMQQAQVKRREAAYQQLQEILPARKARKLAKLYRSFKYAASREVFKHHVMQLYRRVRKQLFHRADEFISLGRLDEPGQVFYLTLAQVDEAVRNPDFDIRAAVAVNSAFPLKLKSCVRHLPMAIDSRGRILRAEPKIEDGALVGAPVSAGIARGPVKVMHDPFEKEILPGDVLVAVTTDPGWTPLFINAAAVILEIGGELQHGALVAREYGKPCVSSIPDVTSQFTDGQIVEVDGGTGVIRFID